MQLCLCYRFRVTLASVTKREQTPRMNDPLVVLAASEPDKTGARAGVRSVAVGGLTAAVAVLADADADDVDVVDEAAAGLGSAAATFAPLLCLGGATIGVVVTSTLSGFVSAAFGISSFATFSFSTLPLDFFFLPDDDESTFLTWVRVSQSMSNDPHHQ